MKASDVTPGQQVKLVCGCLATRAVLPEEGHPTFWVITSCEQHRQGEMVPVKGDAEVIAIRM